MRAAVVGVRVDETRQMIMTVAHSPIMATALQVRPVSDESAGLALGVSPEGRGSSG